MHTKSMQILKTLIILWLLISAVAACAPKIPPPENTGAPEIQNPSPSAFPSSTPEPDSQPDLIIKFMSLGMSGNQANCVSAYSKYGIYVLIENIGSADASPFMVELNSSRQHVADGLRAGESIGLFFEGTTPSGSYTAIADVTDQVMESREDNNTSSYNAPTPTPPLLCTPTPTATP